LKSARRSISNPERRWILIILDLLALNAGFLISLLYRVDYILTWELVRGHPLWFLLLNGLWFFWSYLLQAYNLEKAGQLDSALLRALGAGLITISLFLIVPYIPPLLPPSRSPLFVTILVPVLLLGLGRLSYLVIFGHPDLRRRVLIVGAGWAGQTICRALVEHGRVLYEVIGFMDDDPAKQGRKVEINHVERGNQPSEKLSYPVFGGREQLLEVLARRKVTTIVLAVTDDVSGELYQILSDSLKMDVEVTPMPLLYEQLTGKVPVEHIGAHWSVAMPVDHPGTSTTWHIVKRLFDIFWASLGLIFLTAAFPIIAAAIYIDSPGRVLYRQKRLGRNEKPFWMYKFRSMVPDAEKEGPVWAEESDPRVTRVGRFIRKTHLDEFPQFINILKGEMSVVGPRPERPEIVEELAEQIPFYRVRLAVKPGMAGWGLIHQGYGASQDEALEKLRYDLYYIKHQSLLLDLYILIRTFWDTVTFGGR